MTDKSHKLAVVIPVYNEGPVIRNNLKQIMEILDKDNIKGHYLLVDDGSTDSTWPEILSIANEYENVAAIRFARNFGKEAALFAGLTGIDAQTYLIIDSDMQHPPRYVKEMIAMMKREQADIVNGIKLARGKEPLIYRLFANSFYRFMKMLTGLDMIDSSDFKLLDRRVVEELRNFEETRLFMRGLIAWVGFKQVNYEFEVDNRKVSKTRFSKKKLIRVALNSVLAHTSKPLYLTILIGITFFVISFALAIQTLYNFFKGFAVSGFTTVILLILLSGSMIMISLGIIGLYISRIYDEVKNRPPYIISESIGT